jgi:hypothetical protein
MTERLPRHPRRDAEHHGADRQVGRPGGGHPEHHDEEGEEQQGRAEVAFGHHHHDGQAPRHQHRTEVLRIGQVQRAEAERPHGQQLALLDEVRGEEDGQGDLGQLTGLEPDRAEAHPDARPVDGSTHTGDQRQEQQADAHDRERVAVALDGPRATHDHQHPDEAGDAHEGPGGLQRGQLLVEAGDDDVADAVEPAPATGSGRRQGPAAHGGGRTA